MTDKSRVLSVATLFAALTWTASAQSTLVDWNQSWNYMHPTDGTLPAGSGTTTPHPDGTTPWFANETDFNATYSGPSFTTSGAGFEAGAGAGPLGYGDVNYFTEIGAEFTSFGTTLTRPSSGDRYTAYLRTTFTVPDDGNFYVNPTIRYLLDDGGFIYLDGEPILRINVAATNADDYLTNAAGTGNTESQIRTAQLFLDAGASTGGNNEVVPAIANNATVLKSIGRLTPGVHTLAVSTHNSSATSSDLALALQVVSETTDCLITAEASDVVRDIKGTTGDPSDDTFSTNLTVTPEGSVGATWVVIGPAGTSTLGQTGAYNTPVSLSDMPLAEFEAGFLDLELADTTNATCTTKVRLFAQRLIATNDILASDLPISTINKLDVPGWTVDDATRVPTLNNPRGTPATYVLTSEVVDTSGQPDLQFFGTLEVNDGSSGTEEEDSFVAYLIYDGDTANPVNLISRHDLITPDGLLTGDELAPAAGDYSYSLNQVIPASVNSVQILIEAVNNSANESFSVTGMRFAQAPPQLQVLAGPAVFDNKGTPDPADDTFSADLTITPVNLGASNGWTSDSLPESGLYSDPSPVTFGPFAPFIPNRVINFTDNLDPTKTAAVTISLAPLDLVVGAPTNITRVENGPGFDDDTVTFDVDITGTNGGPGWSSFNSGVLPTSNDYGLTTFTVPAPLTPGPLTFEIYDTSYRNVSDSITFNVPARYIIGQSDLTGSLVDVSSDLSSFPDSQWINDPVERTLTLDNGGNTLRVVTSETIDLSTQGEIYFSARLQAIDTSASSNFETDDQFKAELVYTIDGVATTINLIDPWDAGNGASAVTGTTGGVNGPPNGFLNGYQGEVGTDLIDGTVYATEAEDYNANRERDELNALGVDAESSIDNTFLLKAAIPAEADDVVLIISGQGMGTTESIVVRDVLFSTEDTLADSDSDGIPDDYEIANGLDPLDPNDALLDLDGDGRSNIQEYVAGTAANDAKSFLGILTYDLSNDRFSATWTSVPGKTYIVQQSTDLVSWSNLGSPIPAEEAPATETSSPLIPIPGIDPPKAFYRVSVVTEPGG
ncbi:MAG: hypothetical protein ACON5N_07815 [Akkermansiaceae bacterium]